MKLIYITTVVAATLMSGNAATLAQYTFDNTSNSNLANNAANVAAFSASSVDANVTAGVAGSGPGFDAIITAGGVLFGAEGQGVSDGPNPNLAGAINDGDYFTVSISANAGYLLDLDSFDFGIGRAANGTTDYAVFTSIEGFDNGDELLFSDGGNIVSTTASNDVSVDLSSSLYDSLETIEFRIVIDNRSSNSSSSSATFIDNVTISGLAISSVAIPEPSSVALLGLGGLVLVARRKRV